MVRSEAAHPPTVKEWRRTRKRHVCYEEWEGRKETQHQACWGYRDLAREER